MTTTGGGNGPAELSSSTKRTTIGTIRAGVAASNGTGWWIRDRLVSGTVRDKRTFGDGLCIG